MFFSKANRVLLNGSFTILLLISLVNIWPRIYGISRLSSHTYPEGWNAYHEAVVLRGDKLYGEIPRFVVANYPPIFYHVVALVSGSPDHLVTVGRFISLCALLLTSLLTGLIVFRTSRDKISALLASVLLLTWLSTAANGYMVTNEPQMLAHALICAGLAVYISSGSSVRGLLVVSALFCLALFVKNNVIAVPIAVSLHLLLSSVRRFLQWIFFGVLSASLLLGVVIARDGTWFVRCVLAPRSYDLGEALHGTRNFVDIFQIPLIVAFAWCCFNLRVTGRNLYCFILASALVVGAVFRGGGGTNFNMFFDAIIAMALICSLAFAHIRAHLATQPMAVHLLAVSPLLLCLWSLAELGPGILGPAAHVERRVALEENEYRDGVGYLKNHPGRAICETMRLCFDSGKPLAYDPYYAKELVKLGKVKDSDIAEDIRNHRYSVIQFDALFDASPQNDGRLFFSQTLMSAIREYYEVGFTESSYTFWVPKTPVSTAPL